MHNHNTRLHSTHVAQNFSTCLMMWIPSKIPLLLNLFGMGEGVLVLMSQVSPNKPKTRFHGDQNAVLFVLNNMFFVDPVCRNK